MPSFRAAVRIQAQTIFQRGWRELFRMSFATFTNLASWVWRRKVLSLGLLGAMLFGAFYVGRTYYPRVIREVVDREIVKTVERLLPGEVRTVIREVPGAVSVVRVPVEVTRTVTVAGPERIVTITRPVDVPVEVIRDRWPQVITVRVGSVQSGGLWYTPDFPDLTIGQVTQGVYAVSAQMPGWKIEKVTTETQIGERLRDEPLFQRGFTVGVRTDFRSAWADVVYRDLAFGGEYQIRASGASWNAGPSWMVVWDKRF